VKCYINSWINDSIKSRWVYMYDVNVLWEEKSQWRQQHHHRKKYCHVHKCILMSYDKQILCNKQIPHNIQCLPATRYQQRHEMKTPPHGHDSNKRSINICQKITTAIRVMLLHRHCGAIYTVKTTNVWRISMLRWQYREVSWPMIDC